MARLFVACNGLPALVGLIEEYSSEYGHVVSVALEGVWLILERHRPIGAVCRLLANHGLCHRLVRCLTSIMKECVVRWGLGLRV